MGKKPHQPKMQTKKRHGKANAPGVKALYSADTPILAFGDGRLIFGENEINLDVDGLMDAAICPISGGLLVLDGNSKIWRAGANGACKLLADLGNGFADCLIANKAREILAIALSRNVKIINAATGAQMMEFTPPMAPNSIAFDEKGENLVVGHGRGLSLYDLKGSEPPIEFSVPVGVIGASFSPDLRFLIAATNEPSLVGWRLGDGKGFRMAGYPSKPASMAWLNGGTQLVTSGGPVAVIWPFLGDDGPMGKGAQTFRTRVGVVSAVSGAGEYIGLGYMDGGVDLINQKTNDVRHIGGTAPNINVEIDLRKGQSNVVSVAMPADAKSIAWVCEDGNWGILQI